MWPFRKRANVVTSEEFAATVMELMRRSGRDFCAELQKEAEDMWPLDPNEITVLGNESFVAYLWMASNALGPDKRILDSLHDGYFHSCYSSGATHEEGAARASTAQSELSARYERYYKAWDSDLKTSGGLALAFEMSQFFFPQRKPVLNAMLHFLIQTHVQAFTVSLLSFRKQYELKDT
jgi:hypothetical protein